MSVMSKKPKVVPIATSQTQPSEEHPRLISHEEASRRFILGIGSQRIAFDCSVRATNLPPHTGDKPAPVLPLPKKKKSTSDPPAR